MAFGSLGNRRNQNKGRRSFGSGWNGHQLGKVPPNRTYDLANPNYCILQDPNSVPLEEQFKEIKAFLLETPDLLNIPDDGGNQSLGTLPLRPKVALLFWQIGGPCTLKSDGTPAPDPYGGYGTGDNWGYRDSNGVAHAYPEEFAASRGDAYGAAVVHDQDKMEKFAADFTKAINNSFFDSYLIEGMNGGDADIFHGPQYTTPATGLICGSTTYPKTCNVNTQIPGGAVGINYWISNYIALDSALNQYDRVFNFITGCWFESCSGNYTGGVVPGSRILYRHFIGPGCANYLNNQYYSYQNWADPNHPNFVPTSWDKIMSTTNTDELISNATLKTVNLHEQAHRVEPYVYSWAHDVNIAPINSPWGYLNSTCLCQFNSTCHDPQGSEVTPLEEGSKGSGPNTPECFINVGPGHYGPNGLHPYNIMNYIMPWSYTHRPSNHPTSNIDCITGPEPAQGATTGFIQPQNIHDILPNGTTPWQGIEDVWLLAYDIKHIEDGSTLDQNSTGTNKILIRTPMSISSFPAIPQHMFLSFFSRYTCGPWSVFGYQGSEQLWTPDGTLFVSWGPYRPHTSTGGFYAFNSCPVFVRYHLGPSSWLSENPLRISSFSTGGTLHGEPDYFPGWKIEVLDVIRNPTSNLVHAIKLRISST